MEINYIAKRRKGLVMFLARDSTAKIFSVLKGAEDLTVNQIAGATKIPQPQVSQILLTAEGYKLVRCKKDGKKRYYLLLSAELSDLEVILKQL